MIYFLTVDSRLCLSKVFSTGFWVRLSCSSEICGRNVRKSKRKEMVCNHAFGTPLGLVMGYKIDKGVIVITNSRLSRTLTYCWLLKMSKFNIFWVYGWPCWTTGQSYIGTQYIRWHKQIEQSKQTLTWSLLKTWLVADQNNGGGHANIPRYLRN